MTLAALVDAGVDPDQICAGIDSLGLPGVKLTFSSTMKGGFHATSVKIEHPKQHAHRHLSDIIQILKQSDRLTARQYELSLALFSAIAAAEAKVHGSTIDKVHFHEVGAIDSIVDIVGVAIGFDLLGVEQIISSPVLVSSAWMSRKARCRASPSWLALLPPTANTRSTARTHCAMT